MMSETYLGPVKLDANGEAEGDGWRVVRQAWARKVGWPGHPENAIRRDMGCTCQWEVGDSPCEYHAPALDDEAAYVPQASRPQHLTCGPLRLEKVDGTRRYWGPHPRDVREGEPSVCVYEHGPARLLLGARDAVRVDASGTFQRKAELLAAAIEASTDPAVVRFREEHWIGGGRSVTGLIIDDLDPGAYERLPTHTYWSAPDAMVHWVKRMSSEQLARWKKWDGPSIPHSLPEQDMAGCTAQQVLSRVLWRCPCAFSLHALVAELMATHDYFPEEAARRARYLVAAALAPLDFLVASPEEQIAACRAQREGAGPETLGGMLKRVYGGKPITR